MDDLEPIVSQMVELVHNKKSTEKILQQWGERDIPHHVFQTALDNHNTDFVREHIGQSSRLTKQNILDQAVLNLDVSLVQSIIPYISKNSYPFLAATVRVYKKENALPMLQVLTTQVTTTEKIILAKGLLESALPIPLSDWDIQERINCLTQNVDEAKLYSTLTKSSLPRTKEAFSAALNYHQNQRIGAQISSNNTQRLRKL